MIIYIGGHETGWVWGWIGQKSTQCYGQRSGSPGMTSGLDKMYLQGYAELAEDCFQGLSKG